MTHKLLLVSAFAALCASLSWGDETGSCPSMQSPQTSQPSQKTGQQAGTVENREDTSRIAQSPRHDPEPARLESLPQSTHNPTGVNENSDRTAAN